MFFRLQSSLYGLFIDNTSVSNHKKKPSILTQFDGLEIQSWLDLWLYFRSVDPYPKVPFNLNLKFWSHLDCACALLTICWSWETSGRHGSGSRFFQSWFPLTPFRSELTTGGAPRTLLKLGTGNLRKHVVGKKVFDKKYWTIWHMSRENFII